MLNITQMYPQREAIEKIDILSTSHLTLVYYNSIGLIVGDYLSIK